MPIFEKLTSDMKDSMRSGEKDRLKTIRSLRAAVQRVQIDGGTRDQEPSDTLVEEVLQKQAKMRREALDQYNSAGREDLASIEAAELKVIEGYLPEQLDDEAIREQVQAIISQTGASSAADFGKVMGPAMGALKGRADGKRVQVIVRDLLTAE
ncbi:MAG: GatB/YqeY domain-containing protein [Rhodothermales bacterium]|nr:GatB/YqeY domain-containing protein [Rhodothermales bacterium]